MYLGYHRHATIDTVIIVLYLLTIVLFVGPHPLLYMPRACERYATPSLALCIVNVGPCTLAHVNIVTNVCLPFGNSHVCRYYYNHTCIQHTMLYKYMRMCMLACSRCS